MDVRIEELLKTINEGLVLMTYANATDGDADAVVEELQAASERVWQAATEAGLQ